MAFEGVRDVPCGEESEEILGQSPTYYPIRCRSIRIGLYKIHPFPYLTHLPVDLSEVAISFPVQILKDLKRINITLRYEDITRVLVHFGKALPLMFIYTTVGFGERIRAILNMNENQFDPESRNEKIRTITFLIDFMTSEQYNFLKNYFPGDEKVAEIGHKEANEILVRSTPNERGIWSQVIDNFLKETFKKN